MPHVRQTRLQATEYNRRRLVAPPHLSKPCWVKSVEGSGPFNGAYLGTFR